MTIQKKQIKLAEACGWESIFEKEGELIGKHEPESMGRDYIPVPYYFHDLNAIASARDQTITTLELRVRWVNTMRDVVGLTAKNRNKLGAPIVSDVDLLFATSEQLAETLGITLKLWTL